MNGIALRPVTTRTSMSAPATLPSEVGLFHVWVSSSQ